MTPRKAVGLRQIQRIMIFLLSTVTFLDHTPATAQHEKSGHPPESPAITQDVHHTPEFKPASREPIEKQAVDITSSLKQVQFQNRYTQNFSGIGADVNLFFVRPVLPIRKFKRFPFTQIVRLTIPVLSLREGQTGLGDLILDHLVFLGDQNWGRWGVGTISVFPTASEKDTGLEKWQIGPSAALIVSGVPKCLFGFLVRNPMAFAGARDRPHVNYMLLQIFIFRKLGRGWYLGTAPQMIFNWARDNEAFIPLDLAVGRVFKVGPQYINAFVSPQWTVYHDGPAPLFVIRFGVNFLFPEKPQQN
jgi:hypothetical protein